MKSFRLAAEIPHRLPIPRRLLWADRAATGRQANGGQCATGGGGVQARPLAGGGMRACAEFLEVLYYMRVHPGARHDVYMSRVISASAHRRISMKSDGQTSALAVRRS